jgi:hypothetical protein
MSELQTLMALVVLIFVLAVIVQAIQEVVKSVLDTKAETMGKMVVKFMGDHLTLDQVRGALNTRGLDITALENFNQDDFRHLLDGIELAAPQVQGVVANANATIDEVKNNIAGAYEGARAAFQKAYAAKNKLFALIISFVVVLALNASVIRIYEILGANQAMSQAIAGTAATITNTGVAGQNGNGAGQNADLEQVYEKNRQAITADLQKYPILVRTPKYSEDWDQGWLKEIAGLLVMGLLVSLGAPFWNDVLKGATGINNVLNTGGKQSS